MRIHGCNTNVFDITHALIFGTSLLAVAVAGVILCGAMVAGPMSGGSFNPAVSIGLCIVDGFKGFKFVFMTTLVHMLAPFLAAAMFFAAAPDRMQEAVVVQKSPSDVEYAPLLSSAG